MAGTANMVAACRSTALKSTATAAKARLSAGKVSPMLCHEALNLGLHTPNSELFDLRRLGVSPLLTANALRRCPCLLLAFELSGPAVLQRLDCLGL